MKLPIYEATMTKYHEATKNVMSEVSDINTYYKAIVFMILSKL